MNFKKAICLSVAILTAVTVYCPKVNAKEMNKSSNSAVSVNSNLEVENQNFVLTADKNGSVKLLVKETGEYWYSNPIDEEMNSQVNGINKMKMQSQLIVSYLVNGKNEKLATSCASATNKKGVKIKASNKGIRIDYCFVKEEFTIPVLYSIDSKGMTASVLNNEIEEKGENTITKIILLPYWGAASTKENGYFLVPDGSGALINFNNGKSGSNYQQNIYDTDGLMNVESSITSTEKANMPIYGIKKENQSVLAVIEGGESDCKLYAFVSGTNGPYNTIYPEFTFRKSSVIKMLSKTWYPLEVTFISNKKVSDTNFSVKFIPVMDEDKGYSGIANEYREYLKKELNLKSKTKYGYVPVYLDIYGSVLVSDNFFGFPITVNKAITDCGEVEEIIKTLKKGGIEDINIRYKGTTKAGLDNKKVPNKFKVTSSIGGKKELKNLMTFAEDNKTAIYPDYDFIYFKRNAKSIFSPNNVIQDVRHKNGVFYEYDISSGRTTNDSKYALKPEKIEKNVLKFLKSYKKFGSKNLSLSTLGNTLFSDYGKDICLSHDTKEKFKSILSNINGEKINTMLEAPYVYALPYANAIISAPVESSNYDIEDISVPFYQMVLHGIVSYSMPSMNSFADSKTAMLKAIETGSSIMYSLSATEFAEIINDGYDELGCTYYKDWLNEIIESGNIVSEVLEKVADCEIYGHTKLTENIYKTVYSNGVSIYVNYGDADISIDGVTVKAKDFCVAEVSPNEEA